MKLTAVVMTINRYTSRLGDSEKTIRRNTALLRVKGEDIIINPGREFSLSAKESDIKFELDQSFIVTIEPEKSTS